MNTKPIGTVIGVVFAFILATENGATASELVERTRSGLEANAAKSRARQSGQLYRDLQGACHSIYNAIEKIEKPLQCKQSCEAEVEKYSEALYSEINKYRLVFKQLFAKKYRSPLPEDMVLTSCLMTAIDGKFEKLSYGLGFVLARRENQGSKYIGSVWAFTSLALGKGVVQSKRAATALLNKHIQDRNTDSETRASLTKLVQSLQRP